MLQTGGSNNVDAIINQKLESDKLLNKYKADMQNAIASFQKYPSGIITSGIVIMKYDKTITVISSAVSDLVENNISSYLLKIACGKLVENFILFHRSLLYVLF